MSAYQKLREELNPETTLVVVSKGREASELYKLYEQGARDFGESRLPEALAKMAQLPQDITWHYLGPIQSNKLKKIVNYFNVIHSIDSPEHFLKFARHVRDLGEPRGCFLQANIAHEPQKQGVSLVEWESQLGDVLKNTPENLELLGWMGMAPLSEDEQLVRNCFKELYQFKEAQLSRAPSMKHLSMGMSQDYQLALKEGADYLRIGTLLFE